MTLHGSGTGPIDAAVRAFDLPIDVVGYHEHACGSGSDAVAVAYVEVSTGPGSVMFGVGRHSNIITASLLAVVSGINRAFRAGALPRLQRAARRIKRILGLTRKARRTRATRPRHRRVDPQRPAAPCAPRSAGGEAGIADR